jgi:hypothetical protein
LNKSPNLPGVAGTSANEDFPTWSCGRSLYGLQCKLFCTLYHLILTTNLVRS